MNIVTHITLRVPGDRRSGIAQIHGVSPPRTAPWHYSEADAIRMIRSGDYEFYVEGFTPQPAKVVVVNPSHPYLKTEPDWSPQNNLLSLPEW